MTDASLGLLRSSEPRGRRRPVARRRRRWALVALLAAACVHRPPPASTFLSNLAQEGYTANKGLSGLFQPGNLIQTMEAGDDGVPRKLNPPIVLAWAADCFPGVEPHESPFMVEQSASKTSRSFALEGPDAISLVPGLSFATGGVRDHRLTVQNPRIRAFAKADVSGRMSQRCMDAIADAVRAGDRPEWFVLVLEAVTVDSLRLEISWSSGTSAEVRDRVTQQAARYMNTLGAQVAGKLVDRIPGGKPAGGAGTGPDVATAGGDTTPDGSGETTEDGNGETAPDGSGETVADGSGETAPDGSGETVADGGGETTPDGSGETVAASAEEGKTAGDGAAQAADAPATRGGRAKRSITHGARAKIGHSDATGTVVEIGATAVVAYRTRRIQPFTVQGGALGQPPAPPAALAPPPASAAPAPGLREIFQAGSAAAGSAPVGRIAVRQVIGNTARRVRLDHPFRSGEAFQLEVTSSRSGWAYLLHARPGETPKVLWPRLGPGGNPLDRNAVRAREPLVVPPPPGAMRFDEEAGDELMYVVIRATQEPPALGSADAQAERDPAAPAYLAAATRPDEPVVQYAVRGAQGARLRGVVFDAGAADPDPAVYFAPASDEASSDAVIEFRLIHAP